MKILSLYKAVLTENVTQGVQAFYDRFLSANQNPDFLKNNFRNPDFELRLVSEGGVKQIRYGRPNKCETNVFEFIQNAMESGNRQYYPVSGWAFMESTSYFEHFWVYDDVEDMFLDVTPVGSGIIAYGGVVNKEINDDILNAKNFFDIDFLKGKAGSSLYSKHMDKEPQPRLNSFSKKFNNSDEAYFAYIERAPQFAELKAYLQNIHVDSIKDLQRELPKIDRALETIKNSREWMYYEKISSQIRNIFTLWYSSQIA